MGSEDWNLGVFDEQSTLSEELMEYLITPHRTKGRK